MNAIFVSRKILIGEIDGFFRLAKISLLSRY